MSRLKRSRSDEEQSRDDEEAIRERKRRKFLDFLERKKNKLIKKQESPKMVKHEGGGHAGKERLQNLEEEKPAKNGQQYQTAVSAAQHDDGSVSQDRVNGSHKQKDVCRTRSEIRRPITRSSAKAGGILKDNSLENPTITTNDDSKLNQDDMSVETITESSKSSSQTSSSSRRPSTRSLRKAQRTRRKSKAVDTVSPLNIDFQTHAAKTPGSGRKQQNYMRGREVEGRTPDTALKIDSSDEEEAVNDTGSAMKSREQRCQSDLQRSVKTIAYPSRADPEAIEISELDIQHLEPSEFLNDTIIDFYIKYIQKEFLSLESGSRFHFFNSFFYKKLSGVAGKKKKKNVPDFSKLRKWTKGINIFEKDYLIIPIHDKLHWSLAIICFPSHNERCILHLDSMLCGHQSPTIFRLLRRYLVAEWKDTFGETQMKENDRGIPVKKVPVPLQENESDCGLFLLHYVRKFVESAPRTFHVEDRLEDLGVFGREWFSSDEASNLRTSIQEKLHSLLPRMKWC